MKKHILPALDAANPLGYLAALGLLRVLDSEAEARGNERPRLGFAEHGALVAVLDTPLELEAIADVVLEDARRQADHTILQLAYSDDTIVPPTTKGASRDLKPVPALAREVLARAATSHPRVANLAAAMFSELVQDNKGNTKPTAFHFTAGQQEFLRMVEELRVGLRQPDIEEALIGPWRSVSRLPSLSWDSAATRMYALRARNPSAEKRGSVPAANWLAVQALEYFPVAVRRGALVTTRIAGGWKDSTFAWAVWDAMVGDEVVRSVQRIDPRQWTAKQRVALGIAAVFSSGIRRTDQGGYGSFTPASPIPPSVSSRAMERNSS